jgi:hypothetical protein
VYVTTTAREDDTSELLALSQDSSRYDHTVYALD